MVYRLYPEEDDAVTTLIRRNAAVAEVWEHEEAMELWDYVLENSSRLHFQRLGQQ